jgi:hypothetical protein
LKICYVTLHMLFFKTRFIYKSVTRLLIKIKKIKASHNSVIDQCTKLVKKKTHKLTGY